MSYIIGRGRYARETYPTSPGAGGGPPPASTSATVKGGQTYDVLSTDGTVLFDESNNGELATAVLPSSPVVGERHTFVWWGWSNAGNPPPLIEGNGNPVVPYAVGIQTSKATVPQTNITSLGGIYSVQWDGTEWMLVAVA